MVDAVSRGHITTHLESLSKLSWRTQNRHKAIIHRLFNFAIEEGHIQANPCASIKRRKPQREKGEAGSDEKVRYLSSEELEILFQLVRSNLRLNALVWLLYESGARINEILSLKISGINVQAREFLVTGKGNKERMCYFDERAAVALKLYLEKGRENPSDMLFTHRGAFDRKVKPLTYQTAHRDLQSALSHNSRLQGLRFHDLRHTFATERAKIIPIEVLRAMLGHESIQTTLIYQEITSRVAGETAREAFKALYAQK